MDIIGPDNDKEMEELQVLWDKEPGFYQEIQEILVDKGTDMFLNADGVQAIQEGISSIKTECDKLLSMGLVSFDEKEAKRTQQDFGKVFSVYELYLKAMTPEKRIRRDGRRTRTEKQYPDVKCDLYDIAITFRDEEIAKAIQEVEKKYKRR